MVVWVFVGGVAETIFGSSKIARKNKNVFGLKLKYAHCTTKVRFLRIFEQFCAVTSVANYFVLY